MGEEDQQESPPLTAAERRPSRRWIPQHGCLWACCVLITAVLRAEDIPFTRESVVCRMALSSDFASLGLREVRRCRLTVRDTLPPFHAVLETESSKPGDTGSAVRLQILQDGTTVPYQEFHVRVNDARQVVLRMDDVNFDGYSDLILSNALCYESRFCRETDHFWIYHPKEKQFMYDLEISHLPGVQWDRARQTLKSSVVDFDEDGLERDWENVYQWKNGHPVMLEESSIQWDAASGRRLRTSRRWVNGEWRTESTPLP